MPHPIYLLSVAQKPNKHQMVYFRATLFYKFHLRWWINSRLEVRLQFEFHCMEAFALSSMPPNAENCTTMEPFSTLSC